MEHCLFTFLKWLSASYVKHWFFASDMLLCLFPFLVYLSASYVKHLWSNVFLLISVLEFLVNSNDCFHKKDYKVNEIEQGEDKSKASESPYEWFKVFQLEVF